MKVHCQFANLKFMSTFENFISVIFQVYNQGLMLMYEVYVKFSF